MTGRPWEQIQTRSSPAINISSAVLNGPNPQPIFEHSKELESSYSWLVSRKDSDSQPEPQQISGDGSITDSNSGIDF
jgi:hypothetical protein